MAYPLGLGYGDPAPTPSGIEHGQDIEVPDGTTIYSPVHGTVVFAGSNPITGGTVGIYSAGHTFWFGHLKAILTSFGDTVDQGNVIGLSGGAAGDPMRGDATGPHLWFAVSQGKQTSLSNLIDPTPFLNQDAIFTGPGGFSVNPSLAKTLGIVSTAGGDTVLTKPWGTIHIPGDGDLPLGSYLKVAAGGFIMLIGVILILVASGLRSGAVGGAAESAPIAGPIVRRARQRSTVRRREGVKERTQQSALERREIGRQARSSANEKGYRARGKIIDLDAEDRAFRAQRIKELGGG
jgi:Peptidase family M23